MALWKFVEDEKPTFSVNAVLPDAALGEVLSGKGQYEYRWLGETHFREPCWIGFREGIAF